MFPEKLIFIYFLYGLAFFVLGTVAIVEGRRQSQLQLVKALPFLGGFGILHAFNEWSQLFQTIPPTYLGLASHDSTVIFQSFSVIASFVSLFVFGLILFKRHYNYKLAIYFFNGLIILYFVGLIYAIFSFNFELKIAYALIMSRYFIAIPSSLLAGLGMWQESRIIKEMNVADITKSFKIVGVGFFTYGMFSLFPKAAPFFPANFLNSDIFFALVGIPIQFFRALVALIITIYSLKSLSVFEYEHRKNLHNRISTLEVLSSFDEVSGLYNHRYFQKAIKDLEQFSLKEKRSFSLLLIDIDYFKEYNDSYGHPEGDRLLNEVGRIIKSLIRSSDIVARYGGDELAVILQNTYLEEAYEVAEKIRRDVASHCFAGSTKKKITLSVGVANFPQCADTKNELIQVADTALYKAKEQRNRTECFSLFSEA